MPFYHVASVNQALLTNMILLGVGVGVSNVFQASHPGDVIFTFLFLPLEVEETEIMRLPVELHSKSPASFFPQPNSMIIIIYP